MTYIKFLNETLHPAPISTPEIILLSTWKIVSLLLCLAGNTFVLFSSLRYNAVRLDSMSVHIVRCLCVVDLCQGVVQCLPKLVSVLAGQSNHISVKLHFSQTTFQSNYISVKLHSSQNTFQSNYISVKLHFSQTTFQSNYISVKLHFSQTTFQVNYISVKLHFGQTTFQSNYISVLTCNNINIDFVIFSD